MARRRRSPTAKLMRAFFPPTPRVRRKVKPSKPATIHRRAGRRAGATKAERASGSGVWIRARYSAPQGARPYFVYVPGTLDKTTAVPLVVALHGCDQGAAEFAASTRLNQ